MTLQCIHGAVVNFQSSADKGFDAWSHDPGSRFFVLCDGANSCLNSGRAARWLTEEAVKLYSRSLGKTAWQHGLRALHEAMWIHHPDTASTLISVAIDEKNLHLTSVGDSRLSVFTSKWWNPGIWQLAHTMPIDLNAQGHPDQLMGSEVLHTIHQYTCPFKRNALVVMMSDGPANALAESHLQNLVKQIGRQTPSHADLDYLAQSLALDAHRLGCQDDISVALIWIGVI